MGLLDRVSEKISQALMVIAAAWMFGIALLILVDVVARGALDVPVLGIPELIANSIVAIAFLQLAYTVRIRAMLRAEVIDGLVGPSARRTLLILGLLLGAAFFALIAWAGWTPMLESWASAEYEGEGGMRVPVYPVRTLVVFCSFLAAVNYTLAAYHEFRSAPEAEPA